MTTPRILIFLLLLVPSAYYAWNFQDMPRFGYLHDDAILFGSASGLANSGEYRIVSLPERPYQTKYPPLYPVYMSLVWKMNPNFPDNLRLATLFNWLLLTPCLALSWGLYRRSGFTKYAALALVAFMAVNPTLILIGTSTMTEVMFTCGVLLVLRLMERETLKGALLAGILAGCVYLSRTAGIAFLISAPAFYLWKGSRRCALTFAGGMFPFVAGWMIWTSLHRLETNDPGLLYYTDYVRFQFLNVGWDNFARVVATNLRETLLGLGSLIFPQVGDSMLLKAAAIVTALAALAGSVRMALAGALRHYALLTLVSIAILLVWHYPPNERFVLPFFTFFLAGLYIELKHVAGRAIHAFQNADLANRLAASVLAGVLAMAVAASVSLQLFGTFSFLPGTLQRERLRQADRAEVYRWMKENVSPSAVVLSADDPLFFLYTGFTGRTLPLMPRDWYAKRSETTLNVYREIASYGRSRHFDYVYYGAHDLSVHWTRDVDQSAIERSLRENPDLTVIHQTDAGAVYRIRATGQ